MKDSDKINLYLEHIYIYKDDVYKIIYSVIRNDFIADDLTQTVLLNAWKGLNTLRNVNKSKQWVKAITRNVIREYFRKKPKTIVVEQADIFMDIENQNDLHGIEQDILDAITTKEEYAILGKALRSLEPVYQTIIRQHIFGEITLKEIASQLDVKYGTARVLYSRGMRMLRDAYFELEKGGGTDG